MYLTEIVEMLVQQVNDKQDQWKPNGTVVQAKPTMDFVGEIGKGGYKVLFQPELSQYDLAGERKIVHQLRKIQFVTLYVSYTFEGTAEESVAPWPECKIVQDMREDLEDLILTTDYSPQKVAVVEVEPQPPLEVELKRRNYNVVTSFGFEAIQCGSSHELEYSPTMSGQDTIPAGTRASIRRRALSGLRRDVH